jgi:hypothetical protein
LVVYLGDGGAGGGGVGDGLAGGAGGEQGGCGEPVDGAGEAAAGLVDQVGGVIGEKLVGPAGELGVMPQVGPGLAGVIGAIAYRTPIRWSRAARTPSFMLARRWGWPMSRTASGLAESSWALVSIRIASSWSWDSRCASSIFPTARAAQEALTWAFASRTCA